MLCPSPTAPVVLLEGIRRFLQHLRLGVQSSLCRVDLALYRLFGSVKGTKPWPARLTARPYASLARSQFSNCISMAPSWAQAFASRGSSLVAA